MTIASSPSKSKLCDTEGRIISPSGPVSVLASRMKKLRCFGHSRPVLAAWAVIDAGEENLLRVRDHRQPLDVGWPVVGLGRVDGLPYFGNPAGRERITQGGVTETLVQRDHALAGHHAEARLAVGHVACEFHSPLLVARDRPPAESPCIVTSARRYCP